MTCKCHKEWHQSPSLQALTLMINTYYHVCRICHKPAWIFTYTHRFLLAEMAWHEFFSSLRFYFFPRKPGLIGFFPHGGFIFPQKPTWSSNCGDKWHRPRILRAWNRWSGLRIKPWTQNKIMLQGQGIEPWTHKKDRSYNRARDR